MSKQQTDGREWDGAMFDASGTETLTDEQRAAADRRTMQYTRVPVVSLRIVREGYSTAPVKVRTPRDIAEVLLDRYKDADREVVGVVHLNTRNEVLAIEPVGMGGLNSCGMMYRDVMKGACLMSSAAVILFHNHPSGDATPSPEDERTTRGLRAAGKLLDIELLDHIVIGAVSWVSMKERGLGFGE